MSTLKIPQILLPSSNINLEKWSVVACDQFTSQIEYWENLQRFVGKEKSTLNLIFPEVYLGKNDDMRIDKIHTDMKKYLKDGVFSKYEGLIYVKRIDSVGMLREGLMLAIDLEDYEYTNDKDALIKATEKTVVERLPARIKVRNGAPLEFPHVMVLCNDKSEKVFKTIRENAKKELYNFTLNMNGGKISGYEVDNPMYILSTIFNLTKENEGESLYEEKKILFAVGDGNHSLATAKECWNIIKKDLSDNELQCHPARYALCEMVNIYDKSLQFEPIHRVVFGAGGELIDYLSKKLKGEAKLFIEYAEKKYILDIPSSPSDAIADIQNALDEYLMYNKNVSIDYIHGEDYLREVAKKKEGISIFMPTVSKESLFKFVAKRGVLPRKSFSMGHAEDKRYYLEGREIL